MEDQKTKLDVALALSGELLEGSRKLVTLCAELKADSTMEMAASAVGVLGRINRKFSEKSADLEMDLVIKEHVLQRFQHDQSRLPKD